MSVRSQLERLEGRPAANAVMRPDHGSADQIPSSGRSHHAGACMPSRPCAAEGARNRGRRANASCSTVTPRCRQASWSPSTRARCPVRARLGLPSGHRSARGGRFAAAPNRQASVGAAGQSASERPARDRSDGRGCLLGVLGHACSFSSTQTGSQCAVEASAWMLIFYT